MRPALKIRYLLDFTARKFRNVVFKIRKVVIFKTNSVIAQYFKDISIIISILFTGQKDGPKLAKFHFCQQIQYPFSIHNSDRVAESLSKSSIFPTFAFLIELLKVYFNPDGTGKKLLENLKTRGQTGQEVRSQSRGKISNLEAFVCDVIGAHSWIMKHAHAIKFGYLNLLAML